MESQERDWGLRYDILLYFLQFYKKQKGTIWSVNERFNQILGIGPLMGESLCKTEKSLGMPPVARQGGTIFYDSVLENNGGIAT